MNTECDNEQELNHRLECLIAIGEALYVPEGDPRETLPRLIESACGTCMTLTLLKIVQELEEEQGVIGRSTYLIGTRMDDCVREALNAAERDDELWLVTDTDSA